MHDLEYSKLLDLPVDTPTVRTGLDFATLFVDPFAYLGTSQVIDRFSSQLSEESLAVRCLEEDFSTTLWKVSI